MTGNTNSSIPFPCFLIVIVFTYCDHPIVAGQVTRWLSSCGNRVVEGLEECDDGDVSDGNGCSASCKVSTRQAYIPWTCIAHLEVSHSMLL